MSEHVRVAIGSAPSLSVVMKPSGGKEVINVKGTISPLVEATSSAANSVISAPQIKDLPLAARGFANIAYVAPMTEPVEPSNPTKARITAVSFAGSSGLNVDLSVDGGDNNGGKPYFQIDMRVSRDFRFGGSFSARPFIEFFNLLNRTNPGNHFLADPSAFPTPVRSLVNATAFCLNANCSQTSPVTSPKQLRLPAGALEDFFGPGTTVGLPFAAQVGVYLTF